MDPQIEFYKAALLQRGAGFEIAVFISNFRYQYGQGFNNVF